MALPKHAISDALGRPESCTRAKTEKVSAFNSGGEAIRYGHSHDFCSSYADGFNRFGTSRLLNKKRSFFLLDRAT
jgi:hypothetical protein